MVNRHDYGNIGFITSSLDIWRIYNLLDGTQGSIISGGDELLDVLRKGITVGPRDIPPNVITMNCELIITISEPSDEKIQLKLVYPDDADEENTKISVLSPLGRALIGAVEGATISYQESSGETMVLKIDEIIYQPEREGHYQI